MTLRVYLLAIFATFGLTSSAFAQNLNLFGLNTDYKKIPNCYLQKEYNYFVNQWTTNEICNPRIIEIPERDVTPKNIQAMNAQGNQFLGTSPFTYSQPVYNQAPVYTSAPMQNYVGYYAGRNNTGTSGGLVNYLLSSYGGYNSGSYAAGWGNAGFLNSLYYYTPRIGGIWRDFDYYPTQGYWGYSYVEPDYSYKKTSYATSYSDNSQSNDYSTSFSDNLNFEQSYGNSAFSDNVYSNSSFSDSGRSFSDNLYSDNF